MSLLTEDGKLYKETATQTTHMKNTILTVATVLAFGLALVACKKSEVTMPGQPGGGHQMQAARYACPMHPEVTDTKASKCPKCGMTLEPAKASSQ